MYSYLTMSSDTSPLLSASVYFNPLSLYTSLVFSFFIPLSCSVSFFLPLCSDFSLSATCSSPLCDIARAAHTHAFTLTQSHTGTPWLRLAGLFELCGIALRDCAWLCMWHVWCVFMCAHVLMGVCVCLHVWQRVPPEVWNRGFEAATFVIGLWL